MSTRRKAQANHAVEAARYRELMALYEKIMEDNGGVLYFYEWGEASSDKIEDWAQSDKQDA